MTSSPWPGRIDILTIEKVSENEYVVDGNIIEFTSVEIEEGGIAAKREITIEVQKINDKLFINDVTLRDYEVIEKSI